MRLINRSRHSPLGRQACDAALANMLSFMALWPAENEADLYRRGSGHKNHC